MDKKSLDKAAALGMNHALVQRMFDDYIEQARLSTHPDEHGSIVNAPLSSERGDHHGDTTTAVTAASCIADGCKRKRKPDCANEMCFRCCYAVKSVHCDGHHAMKIKRAGTTNRT